MTTRIRFTAIYMWPGSFLSETDTRALTEGTLEAALAAMPDITMYGSHAFGFEITETPQKRFVSDDGEERWLTSGASRRVGRWYFGEALTLADVEALNAGDRHNILLANMRGNGWESVVRTIAGNWQPIEEGDVVLPASEHPYIEAAKVTP